jgi:hypothetical protein
MVAIKDLESNLDQLRSSTEMVVSELTVAGTTCESLGVGLHAAIVLKEHQRFAEAERVFDHLKTRWAADELFAYEYIQFLRRVGRDEAADAALIEASRRNVEASLLRECIVRGLVERAEGDVRIAVLEALTWAASHGLPAYMQALINFLSSAEMRRALSARQEARHSLDDSFRMCRDAIQAGTPFCLIRLGDGEGAFLNSLSSPASQQALFLNHREHFTARWYDDRGLASDPAFLAVAAEIEAGLPAADIIGIPQRGWIDHEIRMRNLRSIVCCLQLARMASLPALAHVHFASTTIALDLDYRGLLRTLLAESGPVSVITSHPDLGARLEAAGRATVRRVIPIPGAHSDRSLTGYDRGTSHFRDAFDSVNAAIDQTEPGEVVLVAAGFLGKSYCLRIKRRGGIALDLGSLVDLWMGHNTRPSFHSLAHMTL